MYSIKIVDKDEKDNIINTHDINLDIRITNHGDWFKYEILSNWDDCVCVQEFNPEKEWFVKMTKEEAERYASIVTARMLTTNQDIYEAISWWWEDSFIVASAILRKTFN